MKVNQLNHTALHVADVPTSIEFYKTVLCLEQLPRPAFQFPGAWFSLGPDQELHLIGGRTLDVVSESRGTHFAMHVEDIVAAEKHLQTLGIDYDGPKDRPDGAVQIFIHDPDGHTLELTTVENARAEDRSL